MIYIWLESAINALLNLIYLSNGLGTKILFRVINLGPVGRNAWSWCQRRGWRRQCKSARDNAGVKYGLKPDPGPSEDHQWGQSCRHCRQLQRHASWTSLHSHPCLAGRAEVCRGGDQRPNTLSLPRLIRQSWDQHHVVQSLSSWGGHLNEYFATNYKVDKPRKKWSEMLKVLSPWRARIIPPCKEACKVMSLVTGRLAYYQFQNQAKISGYWQDIDTTRAPAAQVHSWKNQRCHQAQQTLDSAETQEIVPIITKTAETPTLK